MNSSTSSSDRVPAGCVWALLLIAVFELFVHQIPPWAYEKSPYEMSMLREKERLSSAGGDYEIVILGTSFGWAGLKPGLIGSELHARAYNFSTNLAQTNLLGCVLLERYLSASERRPGLVLIEVSPWGLTYEPAMNADYFNRFLLPITGARPDILRELPARVAMGAVARAFSPPSVTRQYFLQKGDWPLRLLGADRGDYERMMALFGREGGYFDESWDPGKRPVDVVTEIAEEVMAFRLSPLNTRYLEKMLELCGSRGVPVVLYSQSVRSDAKRFWEKYRVERNLEEYIAGVSSRHPCVRGFLNMTDAVPETSRYADDYHLNDAGATAYTRALCDGLREMTPESRAAGGMPGGAARRNNGK